MNNKFKNNFIYIFYIINNVFLFNTFKFAYNPFIKNK